MVDQHFPNKFFDIIIGGEDVKKAKPSPQGLLKALRCLHRKKKDTLYIGDSIIDAQTALLAGVDFVGVLNGMTTREELAEYRHRQILPDLTLLPLINKETTPPLLQRLVSHKALIYYRLLHQKQIRGKKELPKDQQPHMQELQKDVSRQLLSRLRTDTKYATLHYSQRLPEHIKRIFQYR